MNLDIKIHREIYSLQSCDWVIWVTAMDNINITIKQKKCLRIADKHTTNVEATFSQDKLKHTHTHRDRGQEK